MPSAPAFCSLVRWRGAANSIKSGNDGNSITAGGQAGAESVGGVPGYMKRNVAPFSAQAYANVAIGGQNTDAMIANATDIDNTFDATKVCILFAQDITNQAGVSNARGCVDRLAAYVAARRAAHPWAAVVLATCGPVWSGDDKAPSYHVDYNAILDGANTLLRNEWPEFCDMLVETRATGGPFDPAHWPDYLRATFFDTTTRTDAFGSTYSNHDLYTNETVNQIRIHYSVIGIQALVPIFSRAFFRIPVRNR